MSFLQIWVRDEFRDDFREDSKVYLIESQVRKLLKRSDRNKVKIAAAEKRSRIGAFSSDEASDFVWKTHKIDDPNKPCLQIARG